MAGVPKGGIRRSCDSPIRGLEICNVVMAWAHEYDVVTVNTGVHLFQTQGLTFGVTLQPNGSRSRQTLDIRPFDANRDQILANSATIDARRQMAEVL